MANETCCSTCGKSATLNCGQCRGAWYCDANCQKAHWKKHKSTCKQITYERTVYRAAETLQQMFYLVREKTFDVPIKKIENKGSSLIMYNKPISLVQFIPFPNKLVSTVHEKQMVLSYQMCTYAQAFFHDTLVELLKGIKGIEIEEWRVQMKEPSRRTRIQHANGELDSGYLSHQIILVGIDDPNMPYVIDIAGAQFSIFESCMSYKNYRAKYIEVEYEKVPGGTLKQWMKESVLLQGSAGLLARTGWAIDKVFEDTIHAWKTRSNLSLPALLALSEKDFVKKRTELLMVIGSAIDNFVATADFKRDQYATARYDQKHPLESSMAFSALLGKTVRKAAQARFLKEFDFHRLTERNSVVKETPEGKEAYEIKKKIEI